MRVIKALLGVFSLAILAAPAFGQAPKNTTAKPKSLTIAAVNKTAAAEAAKSGKSGAREVRPGDVLSYKVVFVNRHKTTIRNVRIDGPVPSGTSISRASEKVSRTDAEVRYAVDGKSAFEAAPAETLTVNGQSQSRAVSAERFSTIRWIVAGNVLPGDTVVAEYEVKVKTTTRK